MVCFSLGVATYLPDTDREGGMHYTIEHDRENRTMRAVLRGKADVASFGAMLRELRATSAGSQCCRFLLDQRGCDYQLNTLGIYQYPQLMSNFGFDRSERLAVVFAGDDADYRFLETVAQNRGYSLQIFRDPDLALAWLTAE
jgi:hypothetical protein